MCTQTNRVQLFSYWLPYVYYVAFPKRTHQHNFILIFLGNCNCYGYDIHIQNDCFINSTIECKLRFESEPHFFYAHGTVLQWKWYFFQVRAAIIVICIFSIVFNIPRFFEFTPLKEHNPRCGFTMVSIGKQIQTHKISYILYISGLDHVSFIFQLASWS